MVMGRPKLALELNSQEREQLESFARSRSLPASLSLRARMVLASAEGEPNSSISQRLQVNKTTVRKWRTRFIELRIKGLYDDLRPGRAQRAISRRCAGLSMLRDIPHYCWSTASPVLPRPTISMTPGGWMSR